jgi:hypothetical protein
MDISTVQLSWSEVKAFIDSLALVPLLKASWSEFKEILGLVGLLLVAVAAVLALRKLPQIIRILEQYRQNRSSIVELHSSVAGLEKLMPNLQEAARALETALPQINKQLEALHEKLAGLQDQADERSRIEEAEALQAVDLENIATDHKTVQEKWREFVDVVKIKLPDADLRRVGEIGSRLMDRRRNNPISLEDAKLIAAIGTQHKRFGRVDPTDDEVAYFNAAVDKAVQKISMVGQKSAPRTNGGQASLTMQ